VTLDLKQESGCSSKIGDQMETAGVLRPDDKAIILNRQLKQAFSEKIDVTSKDSNVG
jgi:hypothetical protein